MKKLQISPFIITLICLFSIQLSFGQGTEAFDGFAAGCDQISTGSFMGNNNITWKYNNCRGDSARVANYTNTFSDNGFKSVAWQFSQKGCVISQTNEYVAPPDTSYHVSTKEWHLKASYGPGSKNRVLTLIQVMPSGNNPVSVIKLNEGDFQYGDWRITAELNGNNPASLYIRNETKDVTFSLGNENPLINDVTYQRQQSGSSVLYDEINGVKNIEEVSDRSAQSTR